MKKNLFFLLIAGSVIVFFSCQKEFPASALNNGPCNVTDTIYVNDTVIIRDTVYIHDTITLPAPVPPTRLQTLVEKEWQLDEVDRSYLGVNSRYVRNGVNTTGVNYQNLRLRFNSNGTGSYTDETGTVHTLNWSWTSTDERNATLTIGPPSPSTFTWFMIELKDNYLHSTTVAGSNLLLATRYIQVP